MLDRNRRDCEDVDKAADIMRDVVRENEELREENAVLRRFLTAMCLASPTGQIRFKHIPHHSEDIDELDRNVRLEVQYNYSSGYPDAEGKLESYAYTTWLTGGGNTIYLARTGEELKERFEHFRYKGEKEDNLV